MMSRSNHNQSSLPPALAAQMMPVVRRIAVRLARRLPSHVRLDELISAGLLGLVAAYRRFDHTLGDDFLTYAERRIRGAMLDELRAVDPLSRDLRTLSRCIEHAKRAFEAQHGRSATEVEIASELGMELDAYQAARARLGVGGTVSIHESDDDEPLSELADGHAMPADELLSCERTKHAVRGAIDSLPPRLRQVVGMYYNDGRTLRDIGAELGVTESRVSQLQSEAVKILRRACSEPVSAAS